MKKFLAFNIASLFVLFLTTCFIISCGKSKKSKPSGEKAQRPSLFSNLNPLAKAKRKANQLKCANQVGQITKAFFGFASDYEMFPWHLQPEDQKALFGKGNPEHLGTIFAIPGVTRSLYTPKMLASPADMKRLNEFEKPNAPLNFERFDIRENKPVPHKYISYGLCLGSDDQLPNTIFCITRNVSGDDLKEASFVGNIMSGYRKDQGNVSLSDGSINQFRDTELRGLVELVKNHQLEVGGHAIGPPSTKLLLPR